MIEVGRIEIKAIQIGGCSRCACLDEAQNGMPKYFVGSVLLVEQKGVSIKLKMIWKIKYFSLKKNIKYYTFVTGLQRNDVNIKIQFYYNYLNYI